LNPDEGGWAGYSYRWNDAQDEAVLLEKGETRDLGGGRSWTYPSRSDCFACHNLASGRVLGLHGTQVNRDGQIEQLEERDAFDGDGWLPPLSDGRDEDSIEIRARSYLAVNCGNCHRSNGPAAGLGDFRIDTKFELAKLCNVPAQSGESGAVPLVPGSPEASGMGGPSMNRVTRYPSGRR